MFIELYNGAILNPQYIIYAYKEQIKGSNGFYNIKITTTYTAIDVRYELSEKQMFEIDFEKIKNSMRGC